MRSIEYKPVVKGVSTVDKDAYRDYRLASKVRDPKKFNYHTDYSRVIRKIWKKIADYSIEYESGVYAENFFYLVPQVIAKVPYIRMGNRRIKTNRNTDNNVYTPIFCNLFGRLNHFSWSLDGTFMRPYKKKLKKQIDKYNPRYYFILNTLRKNKL